jgi:hypothetical protein
LRSFRDLVEKETEVHVSVEETVALEVTDKKGAKDVLLDTGDAVAMALYIIIESVDNKEDIDDLCELMKKRVSA